MIALFSDVSFLDLLALCGGGISDAAEVTVNDFSISLFREHESSRGFRRSLRRLFALGFLLHLIGQRHRIVDKIGREQGEDGRKEQSPPCRHQCRDTSNESDTGTIASACEIGEIIAQDDALGECEYRRIDERRI